MVSTNRTGKLQLQGVIADGVARPGSDVFYALNDASKGYSGTVPASCYYEIDNYINDINREYTQVLGSYDETGVLQEVYEYGNERLSYNTPQEKLYYAYDGQTSVSNLTNTAGQSVVSYTYTPNGEFLISSDTDNPYNYNSEYTDYTTGDQYLRARYYSPTSGNFLTQDTYLGTIEEPLSRNLYTYAENNPINFNDPSGHGIFSSIKSAARKVGNVVTNAVTKVVSTVKTTVKNVVNKVVSKAKSQSAVGNRPSAAQEKSRQLMNMATKLGKSIGVDVLNRPGAVVTGLLGGSNFMRNLSQSFIDTILKVCSPDSARAKKETGTTVDKKSLEKVKGLGNILPINTLSLGGVLPVNAAGGMLPPKAVPDLLHVLGIAGAAAGIKTAGAAAAAVSPYVAGGMAVVIAGTGMTRLSVKSLELGHAGVFAGSSSVAAGAVPVVPRVSSVESKEGSGDKDDRLRGKPGDVNVG